MVSCLLRGVLNRKVRMGFRCSICGKHRSDKSRLYKGQRSCKV